MLATQALQLLHGEHAIAVDRAGRLAAWRRIAGIVLASRSVTKWQVGIFQRRQLQRLQRVVPASQLQHTAFQVQAALKHGQKDRGVR
jgi:hypothetical protein